MNNCATRAKWQKDDNVVEEYEADHNHSCCVSYNKFKIHCVMFRIKEIVNNESENDQKAPSEIFRTALGEYSLSPISLPNAFKRKMIKKIYNARHRRTAHEIVSSFGKRTSHIVRLTF